jgi:hypothetical protein
VTRLSGVIGSVVTLDVSFYKNGVLTDPWAIRQIDIYKSSTTEQNRELTILVPEPASSDYPYPVVKDSTGMFHLDLTVPSDFAQDAYFDMWRFIAEDPGTDADLTDEDLWLSKCNRFWLYENSWYVDDGLETIRFAFEPLDIKFKQPEKRYIEIGLMPLPLYDYNYNLIIPQIPNFSATIDIYTTNCELLTHQPMSIGLRQGTYRSNPFVLKYLLDTSVYIIGTYKYRVTVDLPNGETRVSDDMYLEIL